ncbi:MAG TPA: VWA domain-containing protein [Vicinamibacterales bacterium]|nr:VWA domain-containing protein [Vicinamibacterales bacterium]
MRAAASLLGLGVAAASAAGQDAASPAPVFRAESDLVVLHVNVFDRAAPVGGLPREAFQVFEDDVPQTIRFFSTADVPVSVGLVIDNSTSMLTRRAMVAAGARAFAASAHPEDELFTIVFNEHVELGLPPTVKFTTSRPLLEAALRRFPPGGLTALHDAVMAGLEHLLEASHQKQVLVVLSDGEDNASRHSERDMLERAARSSAMIYTVSTARLQRHDGNPRLMTELADVTGGIAYAPRTEADVVRAFEEIAESMRRGYSIGYVPTNTAHDGRYRRIRVTAHAPGRGRLKVHARDGYLPPRHTEPR